MAASGALDRTPREIREAVVGFLTEGRQGGEALDHLRDVLHDISEQHGVQAVFCARCGGLVTGEDDPEEIEDEAHAGFACPNAPQGGDEPCSP